MHLRERKKSFIKIPTLIPTVIINIDFWQIWHFDLKDTRWVDLRPSIILERFDI